MSAISYCGRNTGLPTHLHDCMVAKDSKQMSGGNPCLSSCDFTLGWLDLWLELLYWDLVGDRDAFHGWQHW